MNLLLAATAAHNNKAGRTLQRVCGHAGRRSTLRGDAGGCRRERSSMKTVKVKRDDLLKVVEKNRGEHRSLFERALVGYREEVIKRLDEMIENAKKNKRIEQWVGLEEPQDMTKEYDRVILMLKMSTEEVIELSSSEFAQYAMDDWSWKAAATASNIKYIK
jgi:hypothetical protein